MTDIWLAIIAISLLVMAVIQVGVLISLLRVAREATAATSELRREVTPLIIKMNKIADDAGQLSALALTQMERVDLLVDTTAQRIDDTMSTVQSALISPVRQGAAVMAGLKAAMAVFGARQDRGRYRQDDEDALFIG